MPPACLKVRLFNNISWHHWYILQHYFSCFLLSARWKVKQNTELFESKLCRLASGNFHQACYSWPLFSLGRTIDRAMVGEKLKAHSRQDPETGLQFQHLCISPESLFSDWTALLPCRQNHTSHMFQAQEQREDWVALQSFQASLAFVNFLFLYQLFRLGIVSFH